MYVTNVCSIDVFIKTINSLYSIDVWYCISTCQNAPHKHIGSCWHPHSLHCYTKLICHFFRSFVARGWPL